jgi:hypothetical protein
VSTFVRFASALLAVLLLAAAPASAAPQAVPPGHSGASQYTETLPTAGGEQPTAEIHGAGVTAPGGGGGNSSGGGSGAATGGDGGGESTAGAAPAPSPAESLGTQNAKRLEKLGAEGKAAARLAAAGGAATSPANDARRPAAADGSSPVKQVVGQLTGTSDSGGMGLLLPLLIAMTVLVAIAVVFTRRRPLDPRD